MWAQQAEKAPDWAKKGGKGRTRKCPQGPGILPIAIAVPSG